VEVRRGGCMRECKQQGAGMEKKLVVLLVVIRFRVGITVVKFPPWHSTGVTRRYGLFRLPAFV